MNQSTPVIRPDEILPDPDTLPDLNQDPRHLRRVKLMQQLFTQTFGAQPLPAAQDETVYDPIIADIIQLLPQIDQQLQEVAPERPLRDINKVDLAILRLIVFESLSKKTPKKVLIDEAVELAKEFGTESSPKFINGVLGQLLMSPASLNRNEPASTAQPGEPGLG